jgi:hypothetical protein
MRPYREHTPDQAALFPLSLTELTPADDPVFCLREVIERLDLEPFHRSYRAERGRPPCHSALMVGLSLYGAMRRTYSSRRPAGLCRRDVGCMYLARERAVAAGEDPAQAEVPERAQPNFTDRESRITHTPDGFQQCYNAQLAVDADSQLMVACEVSNAPPRHPPPRAPSCSALAAEASSRSRPTRRGRARSRPTAATASDSQAPLPSRNGTVMPAFIGWWHQEVGPRARPTRTRRRLDQS